MKNNKKKAIALTIMLGLLSGLMGCGKNIADNPKTSQIETRVYSKQELEMPSGEEAIHITATDEGDMLVVTKKNGTCSADYIWNVDAGGNWTVKHDLQEMFDVDENDYCDAVISSDGQIFASVKKGETDEKSIVVTDKDYYLVDNSGNKQKLDITLEEAGSEIKDVYINSLGCDNVENNICGVKFCDGNIIALDLNCNVYKIDKTDLTCKLVHEGSEKVSKGSFISVNDVVITYDNEKLNYESDDENKKEEIKRRLQDFFKLVSLDNAVFDISGQNLMICKDKLIYRYDLSADKIEKCELNGGDNTGYVKDMVTAGDCIGVISIDVETEEHTLEKYQLDTGAGNKDEAISEKEEVKKLKIWALKGRTSIEQIVSGYNYFYPDVEVTIEMGIEDENDGRTVEDAIKNLNTELLADDGPDVIIMEGLPVEKYINSGLLYDMSDIIDKLCDSGEYFNNFLRAFEDDGIYVVPTCFDYYLKVGTKDAVAASNDYKTFVEYVGKKGNVLLKEHAPDYMKCVYYRDIRPLIDDEVITEEDISDYFEQSKILSELLELNQIEIVSGTTSDVIQGMFSYDAEKEEIIEEFMPDFLTSYCYMSDIRNRIDGELQVPADDFKGIYFVDQYIGISGKSKNVDLAEEFVGCMLKEEVQKDFSIIEFCPVNKNAFLARNYVGKEYEDEASEGIETIVDYVKLDVDKNVNSYVEFVDKAVSKIEGFDRPIYMGAGCDDIVFEMLTRYLNNELSKEEAVKGTIDKINIYMSE